MTSRIKYSLIAGIVAFLLTFLVTLLIEPAHPLWASLIVAFLIFEICNYYFFNQEKRKHKLGEDE